MEIRNDINSNAIVLLSVSTSELATIEYALRALTHDLLVPEAHEANAERILRRLEEHEQATRPS